jgi:hypothetical protein
MHMVSTSTARGCSWWARRRTLPRERDRRVPTANASAERSVARKEKRAAFSIVVGILGAADEEPIGK